MLKVTLLFILGFIWGSAFAIARFVVSHGITPITYSFFIVFIPAIILLIYCYFRGYLGDLFRENFRCCLFAGLFGIVLPNTNKYWLATHLPSGVLALIVSITPFFIYPLALLFREEKFRLSRIIALSIGGVGMIILSYQHGLVEANVNWWLLLALLTPLSYAISALYVARSTQKHTNIVLLTTGMLVCATLFLTPFIFTSEFVMPHLMLNGVILAIIAEIILVITGYIILFKVLQLSGAVNYSLVNGIVAISGIYWGHYFFHEYICTKIILAAICIFTGVILLNFYKKQA